MACEIFSCGNENSLSCSVWDLVFWWGIEPGHLCSEIPDSQPLDQIVSSPLNDFFLDRKFLMSLCTELFASGKWGHKRAAGFQTCLVLSWDICYLISYFPTIFSLTGWKKWLSARPHRLGSSDWDIWTERYPGDILHFLFLVQVKCSHPLFCMPLLCLTDLQSAYLCRSLTGTNFWIRDLYLAVLFLTYIGKKIYLVKHTITCVNFGKER